jgi:adenylate cyclase class 2
MEEIEVKILGIDVKETEAKLNKLGAKQTFKGFLRVKYFDTVDGEIRSRGDLLRVRQFGDEYTEVCYKTNKRIKDGYKIFDEYTLKSDNFDEACKFFEGLGYIVSCFYEKKRTVFKFEDSEIVIDEYPKIPPFVEIEAKESSKIEEIIQALGLSENERSFETINGLLRLKYPQISLNNLTF